MLYPFPLKEEVIGKTDYACRSLSVSDDLAAAADFLAATTGMEIKKREYESDIVICGPEGADIAGRGDKMFELFEREGAYFLDTSSRPMLLAASSPAGAFNAAHSLLKLKEGPHILAARVWDAPRMPLRSVHAFIPAVEDIPFFKRWLSFIAGLKYNTVFLEIGGGMQFKRHPEINKAWESLVRTIKGMGGEKRFRERMLYPKNSVHIEVGGGSFLSQNELRDLLEYARFLNLDIIPEVQSLSHAYYLCCAHPEIAERSEDPYPDTYCPYHPDTYQLLFDVFEEVIDVFHPETINIGHDEWCHIGLCPKCKDTDPALIMAYDITRIHEFLHSRGIRTAMWGDKLMNIIVGGREYGGRCHSTLAMQRMKGNVYPAADMIPRDILILDWYWSLDPFSEQYFGEKGFTQVFGNFNAVRFDSMEKRFAAPNVMGGTVSSWCASNERDYAHQGVIYNTLFSANPFWWMRYTDREKETTYQALKGLMPEARESLGGLTHYSDKEDILSFEDGDCSLKRWGINGKGIRGCRVVSVQRKVKALSLVHFSEEHFRHIPVWEFDKGDYPREYALGKYIIRTHLHSYELPVTYWQNILHPQMHSLVALYPGYNERSPGDLYYADNYYEGRDEEGGHIVLYALPWINPEPDDKIKEIEKEGDFVFAGITFLC